ncbi:MAG: hypothetical protein GX651_04425 [Methanomicrobiales archaeon]|nr:hypothetical protein [Methanomicrobiales archaeon]
MKDEKSGIRIVDIVSDRFAAITTGPRALAALIGFFVLGYLINGRPFGVAELKSLTGGIGILDMEVLFTPQEAYVHLASMGEVGRAFALTHIVPLDLVLPAVYTVAYALVITWLLRQWIPEGSRWHRLNVVPVIGGICDYCENFGIIAMLLAWPRELYGVASFTMAAGLFKFASTGLVFAIIIGAIIGLVATAVLRRSGSKSPQ